jgi:general secretion pathway protein K
MATVFIDPKTVSRLGHIFNQNGRRNKRLTAVQGCSGLVPTRKDCSEMTGRPPSLEVCGRSGGFALIIVLWALVLIAFIIAHIFASGRTEIRIAANLVANAVAEAAADGAIFEAIFNLSDPRSDQRWPVDAMAREVVVGNSQVTVELQDEASWINPNWASPALVEAMLRTIGSNPQSARRLADAIAEWVGSAPVARPQNVVLADYRAAGLDYGPPGAPLETLDELGRVLGMTPATFAAIRPHLTLFGPPQPSAATADPVVAAARAEISQAEPVASANQPPPDVLTIRITATAFGPNNARVSRSGIVRFGAMLPSGYEILAWHSGVRLAD